MYSLAPNHRFHEVLDALGAIGTGAPAPTDPVLAELYSLLKTGSCKDATVSYAHDLYSTEEHRVVLDAFMLSYTENRAITETLGIPENVLERYIYLFMDTEVFRNKLELMSFANNYESSDYGKELVRTAVKVGTDYLLWAYGAGTQELDTRFVIRRTMLDAFFRGMAHKGNALTSNIAKESQKWWSTAVRNAEILERIDPHTAEAAAEELRIALDSHDETLKADQFVVPLDQILH